MKTIQEPARDIPVTASFDVVVVGGGVAGVAAALAAARSGVSTLLVERYCALGGLATIGNVIIYLPLCDGCGHQVLGGITEELLHLSVADLRREIPDAGLHREPEAWRRKDSTVEERAAHRYETSFNPDAVILAYEKLLVDAGVSIWYDTRFCSVVREGNRITHLLLENKDGRTAVACGAVVDATGDADVCFLAGEKTESLDTNVVSGWYYTLRDGGDLRLHCLSDRFAADCGRDPAARGPFLRGDSAADVNTQILEGRNRLREDLAKCRAELASNDPNADLQPWHITTFPCFRMTRRLVAAHSVTVADDHRWFDDAVCLANDWRKPGPVWAVPYNTLYGVANANLSAVGRCMSVDTTAWDALRVIPVCGVTGEAAGVASAMAVKAGHGDLAKLDPKAVAAELLRRGNILDRSLVETPARG